MLGKFENLFCGYQWARHALVLSLTSFAAMFLFLPASRASGLDVQLKDLRNSFYFVYGKTPTASGIEISQFAAAKAPLLKECIKLTGTEVRKYGRLLHCEPEDDHVMCRLKSGEKLFAYESKDACDASLKKGVDPTPL
jgi:hypothetical protein